AFPYMRDNYVLHLGASTVARVRDVTDLENRYLDWARQAPIHHFHGNPEGQVLYDSFSNLFHAHVADESGGALVEALLEGELLTVPHREIVAGRPFNDCVLESLAGRETEVL